MWSPWVLSLEPEGLGISAPPPPWSVLFRATLYLGCCPEGWLSGYHLLL
jgi:hypothetical protein